MDRRAEEMARKRARIQTAVGMGRISQSALARILAEVRRQPELLEDISSRYDVLKSMTSLMRDVETTLPVPKVLGGNFQWPVLDLAKVLQLLVERSPVFADLMAASYAAHPASPAAPWRIVLAEDELTPGALLRLDNKRKALAHYVSFLEFGAKARKHTAAWIPIAFCRSSVIKTLRGATSGLQKALMRHLLLGSDSFREAGVVLPIGENRSPVYVFATLGRTITDELGEKNLWSTRGASSTLPCFLCKNVCCNGEHALVPYAASDYLVDVSCPYEERFDLNTADELYQKCDMLSVLATSLNKENFQEAQRRLGMTYNPGGVLWDPELRPHVNPFEVNLLDAAHGLLCNGIAQREVSLMMRALATIRFGFGDARTIMAAPWMSCHALGGARCRSTLISAFNDTRERYFLKEHHFAGQASEMLIVVPALRFWIEVTPGLAAAVPAQYASLSSLCRVLGMYQRAKTGERVAAGSPCLKKTRSGVTSGSHACFLTPKLHWNPTWCVLGARK